MTGFRLILFILVVSSASVWAEAGGRYTTNKPEQENHLYQKQSKMVSRVDFNESSGNGNRNASMRNSINNANPAAPHQKKPLTREERLALRRQINEAGNRYSRKME